MENPIYYAKNEYIETVGIRRIPSPVKTTSPDLESRIDRIPVTKFRVVQQLRDLRISFLAVRLSSRAGPSSVVTCGELVLDTPSSYLLGDIVLLARVVL